MRVWWCGAGSSTVYRAGCRMSHATDPLGLKRSCCYPGTFLASQTQLEFDFVGARRRAFYYLCHQAAPNQQRHTSLPYQHPYRPVLDFPYHLITCLVYGIAVMCVIVLITPPPPGLNCDDDFSNFFFQSSPNFCWDSQILNFNIKLYLHGYERKFILHFAHFKRFRNHQHPSIPSVIFTKAFVF